MNGMKRQGPCAGLTVLDLSTMVSGPMASQIFGDLGADVIKVEATGGDTMRACFRITRVWARFFQQTQQAQHRGRPQIRGGPPVGSAARASF